MKTLIFFQEPDFEVENYVKREYVLLEGNFNSEKDILCAFMEHFGMDTEFWYKLKLIPLEIIPAMYRCLQLNPNETYCIYILDRSDRKPKVKRTLYRLMEMKKLVEYVKNDGSVIPVPEQVEVILMDEQTVFVRFKSNTPVEEAVELVRQLSELSGKKLYYISDEVEFIRVEEVKEIGLAD